VKKGTDGNGNLIKLPVEILLMATMSTNGELIVKLIKTNGWMELAR
jgi:hypothetical protein